MVSTLIKYRVPAVTAFVLLELVLRYFRFSKGYTIVDPLYLTFAGFIFLFWLVLFVDVFWTRIYNKTFWILAFIIAPIYTPAFYLFQRKHLNHLAGNKFRITP